jgi:hypothetical protein
MAVLLGVGAVTLINLTTQVSGTLPAANGGTGNTANGNNGQVLIGDGAGHFTPQDPLITWNTVTLLSTASATATQSGGPIVLPTRSVFGTFSVVGSGITGSPSGCNFVYSVQNNLGGQNSGTLQTFNFTPANSYQTFSTTPPAAEFTADSVNATYACTAYPSAGTISLVFTPATSVGLGWPLPAGTNVLGHVIIDSGSTTVVTGTVTASATLSAETTKVIGTIRLLGNLGIALDGVIGSAAPANALLFGFKDTSGNTQAGSSDTNGRQFIKVYPDTTTASYRASKKFAASSTTDNAVMPGNATNTVIVTKVLVTCNETTAGQINVELLKRSTADTSGTSAAMTAVPMDSNYSAAVSAPLSYTGTGPTVGTAVGDLDNLQIGCMAPATATPNDIFIFDPDKPIILRGTAQQIAVNVGNAALTGGNVTVTFEWQETTTP